MDGKDIDGNATPPTDGGEGNKETPPTGGSETPPEGGKENPPKAGEGTAPEGGKETPPEGGEDGKGKEGGSETPPGAPENYESFSVPEGFTLSEEAMNAFTPVAKELNLPQEQAQKLVNLYTELRQKEIKDQEDAFVEQLGEWEKGAKEDKLIGGDKYDENLAIAVKAIAAFADPEFKDLLNKTGWGNHPAAIRTFYKIGMQIKEDTFFKEGAEGGNTGDGGEKPMSHRMYPDMVKK